MDPNKPKPTLGSRIVDGLTCETCRRYRRGLALVLIVAVVWWLSGRWS
jgi:hypothetical protein